MRESLQYLAGGGGIAMWVTVFAWWALIVSGLSTLTALVSRDQHWLVTTRRVTFATTTVAIGIFAFAGAYVPASVAPLIPLVLVTLALSVSTIIIVDMRSGKLAWRLSNYHFREDTLWTALASALNTAPSLDSMLLSVASVLRKTTRSRMAVVFKTLGSTGDVKLVGAAAPDTDATQIPLNQDELARLAKHSFTDYRLAEYRRAGSSHTMGSMRWAMIPVQTDERTYATILLANPGMSITDDRHIQTYTSISRMVGHHVRGWIASARAKAQAETVERVSQLQTALSETTNFGQGLAAISRALDGLVPAGYVSLSWLDRARFHEDRVSAMLDDQSIVDQRRRWPVWESTTQTVLKVGRPLIAPDLAALPEETHPTQLYEYRLGFRSRLVMPITGGSRVVGTLTLAHQDIARYGLDETRAIQPLTEVIATWLKQLEHARAAGEFQTATELATRLSQFDATVMTDHELLRTILDGVDATALRLYRLDETAQTLEQIAGVGRGSDESNSFTSKRQIPLTQTPWHRCTMEDRTSHRIDQSDPERLMSDSEASTMMTKRMKTGWIVPIQVGDRITGFLDVMEARDPDRRAVREPERLVLEAGARAFALRWQATGIRTSSSGDADTIRDQLTTLGGTVVNPITGIIGCVELIRQKQPELSEESIKYLNMIENSAARIHESVAAARETLRDDSRMTAPETGTEAVGRRLFGALSVPTQMDENDRYSRLEPVDVSVGQIG